MDESAYKTVNKGGYRRALASSSMPVDCTQPIFSVVVLGASLVVFVMVCVSCVDIRRRIQEKRGTEERGSWAVQQTVRGMKATSNQGNQYKISFVLVTILVIRWIM